MGIKIVKAGEPIQVTTAVALILGVPGIGKTTLANSAEKPLLLDFDRGSHRGMNRPDTVLIDSWKEIEDLQQGGCRRAIAQSSWIRSGGAWII